MPLYANAHALVRANLELLKNNGRPRVVSIGYLTQQQHDAINVIRADEGKPLLENPEVLFMGRHLYESRSAQGYIVDDMVLMVESAMAVNSIAEAHPKMTGIRNHVDRADAYGNQINDLGVLELYARRPKAELLSVIPKGDCGGPNALKK